MSRNIIVALAVVAFVSGAALLYGRSGDGYTDPAALAKLVAEKTEPYILVDTRTPEEYEAGHIPGAVNIPFDVIGRNPPSKDKDALVIVYCRSGSRSGMAKRTLDSLGYTRVEDFGAVGRWKGDLVRGAKP
jgi:rhodanese-related sulfurtransferase